MLLDTGICTTYKVTNTAAAGDMPNKTLVKIADHWFGEMSYESAPVQYTDSEVQVIIERKIRILQDRNVQKGVIVQIGSEQYEAVKVYHGRDDFLVYGRRVGSGELVTDISLTKVVSYYA